MKSICHLLGTHSVRPGCFVSWCWGYLGKHNSVVIHSCVVLCIHQEYFFEMEAGVALVQGWTEAGGKSQEQRQADMLEENTDKCWQKTAD